jgi:hypothetical protein
MPDTAGRVTMRELTHKSGLSIPVRRYAESHRHPVNRAIHCVGIPALAVAGLGLLSRAAPARPGGPRVPRPSHPKAADRPARRAWKKT